MSTHHRASLREEPVARITRKIGGSCEDRSCPATWETSDPETTAITIRLPQPGDDLTVAGPDAPGEITGFVPTALLHAWASGQR
jgi:hypothetical protein